MSDETTPERMGLDAIRQAIEDHDAMQQQYYDLAQNMIYKGNSVSWWHSKAIAYRAAVEGVWAAIKDAGIRATGTNTCIDGVREISSQRDRLLSALRKLVNEPQDITSKAYQHALGVLGEFEG